MDVRQYMNRRCVCGQLRRDHVHFHPVELRSERHELTTTFRVLPVLRRNECQGFLDEIELALGGNPAENPLLAPLLQQQLG